MISTSTHSGDSTVPPLGDSVQAIHLVGAGGVEHWIERDGGITTRARLQALYPCLAAENIHYDTRLFNAVMISAGSMGAIYSVILRTVPQFGLLEHRVLTTWQTLRQAQKRYRKSPVAYLYRLEQGLAPHTLLGRVSQRIGQFLTGV